MLDLAELLEDLELGGTTPTRLRALFRVTFGLAMTALLGAGSYISATGGLGEAGTGIRYAFALLLLALASIGLFNFTLRRPWSWPWKLSVASFVLIFVVRILFGP